MRDWVGGQNQTPLSLLFSINHSDSNVLIFVNTMFEDCSFKIENVSDWNYIANHELNNKENHVFY